MKGAKPGWPSTGVLGDEVGVICLQMVCGIVEGLRVPVGLVLTPTCKVPVATNSHSIMGDTGGLL